MQALSVAIGPSGIGFFNEKLLKQRILGLMKKLQPPDRGITAPDIKQDGFNNTIYYLGIRIRLSKGTLVGFAPVLTGPTQGAGGHFELSLVAQSFTVKYAWHENYTYRLCMRGRYSHGCNDDAKEADFDFTPAVGKLSTKLILAIRYDSGNKSYEIAVAQVGATATDVTPNIPARSVIQQEGGNCFSPHVEKTTADAIAAVPFDALVKEIFPPLLRSISASGQLTEDIRFDFAVGDSGITYPNDRGLAMGVTGRVTYKDEVYPGKPPAPVPLPPPPADDHHLQLYVTDYEVDALHWAFYRAGKLDVEVQPHDLPDPEILKVKTYLLYEPALKPYQAFSMTAYVSPVEASETSFQEVYELTSQVMDRLQSQLPTDVYQKLKSLDGEAYVRREALESDLKDVQIAASFFETIEKAAVAAGMVVQQDLEFKLVIENGEADKPQIVFDVERTDILGRLALGYAGKAQTLQYEFHRVQAEATFKSSSIPHFNSKDFGSLIWPVAGEPRYDSVLQELGKTGVPLPIMQGFAFHFEKAVVSIQKGFVSILSNVVLEQGA